MLQDISYMFWKRSENKSSQSLPHPHLNRLVVPTSFPQTVTLNSDPPAGDFKASSKRRRQRGVWGPRLFQMGTRVDRFWQFDGEARKLLIQHPLKGCLTWQCSSVRQNAHSDSDHSGFYGAQPLCGLFLPFIKLTKFTFTWKQKKYIYYMLFTTFCF